MNKFQNEEVYYCTHCGASNKKSATECIECEKKIISKYRPFYDFLKKHTKEETTDKAVDTVFTLIRKFLLSHIYGIMLSVSIIAAGVATVYGSTSYIKEVKNTPVSNVNVSEQSKSQKTFEISEKDKKRFKHLAVNCDSFAEMLRDVTDVYWDKPEYSSPEELYAEGNIDGFSYACAHDMISDPIRITWLDENEEYLDRYSAFHQDRKLDFESILTGEECTSDIASKLCADGYKVAQADYIMRSGVGMRGETNQKTWEGITTIQKLVYRFVFVEHEGEWYIAEDRLTERFNV